MERGNATKERIQSCKVRLQSGQRKAGVHEIIYCQFKRRLAPPCSRCARIHSFLSSPLLAPLRTDMAPLWLLVFVILVLCVSGKFVILNDTVQLTVNGSCAGGDMKLVRVRRTDGSSRDVATLVGGVWEPADGYAQRIHSVSSSSVNLSGVNFNDDAFYEFTCKSELITTIQLTVIFPYEVDVPEGENFRIPCHFSTDGLQGGCARWEKDGELLLERDLSSTQPEGRLSMSPDRDLTGDMSLTVEGAQLEDGGIYDCYKVDGNGQKTRGTPGTVKVTVTKRSLGHLDCISQQPTQRPDEGQIGPGCTVSIILNVLLFIVAVVFFALWRVRVWKSRRSGGARRGGQGL
ncbi:uncharacterized protein [Pagrus major]|uniref:uncharacterized protein isoform X2 n=1 Tax=Pagrus major TaxID=143350 RepID=UPI003CC898A1